MIRFSTEYREHVIAAWDRVLNGQWRKDHLGEATHEKMLEMVLQLDAIHQAEHRQFKREAQSAKRDGCDYLIEIEYRTGIQHIHTFLPVHEYQEPVQVIDDLCDSNAVTNVRYRIYDLRKPVIKTAVTYPYKRRLTDLTEAEQLCIRSGAAKQAKAA